MPIRVDCPLQQHYFRYVAISLKAGEHRLVGMAEVTDISTERVGFTGCMRDPLVTGSLPAEFLKYHDELGVYHLFSFVNSEKEYTDGKYNIEGDIPHTILVKLH